MVRNNGVGVYDSTDVKWLWSLGAKVTLYSSSGSNGTITLSDSAANYNHLKIYYRTSSSNSVYSSVEVYSPNDKSVSLMALRESYSSGNVYFSHKVVSISGLTISNTNYGQGQYGTNVGVNNTNDIYITRVEGWSDS